MKICHVISGYYRNDARVFLRQVLSLKRAGHEVSIVTNDHEPDEVLDGVPIIACRLHWPRWKVLLAARRQFLPELERVDADVYQLHSPELLPLSSALKRAGKAVVYDAHEDLPRHFWEKEWLPAPLRRPFGFAAELYLRRTLRRIDDVISPHGHVVEHLQRTVGSGVLVANFPLVKPLPPLSEEDFAARPTQVCYAGTVYASSNQEATIDALEQVPGVRYRVAGYVGEEHRAALEARPGGRQVEFLGRLSQAELRVLFSSSVAGMAIFDYRWNLGHTRGTYAVNKVFEYMEAGLPLICTDFTLWQDIVRRYDCGICVRPGNVADISAAIRLVTTDRRRAFEMGQNGRRAVLEEFNWAPEERKYLDVFDRIAARRGSVAVRRTA
ncbi:MAG: glycosyltransferase [Minisyncoccota bacterium]